MEQISWWRPIDEPSDGFATYKASGNQHAVPGHVVGQRRRQEQYRAGGFIRRTGALADSKDAVAVGDDSKEQLRPLDIAHTHKEENQMSLKRIALGAVLFAVILLSGLALFRAQPVAAQVYETSGGAIPKAWGRLVGSGAFPTGGSALYFEAADGTVRIYNFDRAQVLVLPRN